MAARRPQRPRHVDVAPTTNLEDATTSRAVDQVRAAVTKLQSRPNEQTITQDLVVGRNAIKHSLGRAFAHVSLRPSVADPTFAWAVASDNPQPDRQVIITVVGVDQPRASILVS